MEADGTRCQRRTCGPHCPSLFLYSWRVRALSAPSCLEQTPKKGGSQGASAPVPRLLCSATWVVKESVRLHQDVLKDGSAGCEINHAASLSGGSSTLGMVCLVRGLRGQSTVQCPVASPHSPSGRAGSTESLPDSHRCPLGCFTLSLGGWGDLSSLRPHQHRDESGQGQALQVSRKCVKSTGIQVHTCTVCRLE